jgi:hypothetical protein
MKAAVLVLVVGLASASADAQVITTPGITASLDLTWQEDPAFPHNDNGVLEPGEHALILMSESFAGQGSIVTMNPPLGPYTSGELVGFYSAWIHIRAISGDAAGLYNNGLTNPPSTSTGPNANTQGTSGYGVRSGWRLGQNVANGQPAPDGFVNIGAAQGYNDPLTISTTNPVSNLVRLSWAPASYAPRAVVYSVQSAARPLENPLSLFVWTDGGTAGGPAELPLASVSFGRVSIPVAPAPGGLACTTATLILSAPRRRRG